MNTKIAPAITKLAAAVLLLANANGQTTLVNEDWQTDPIIPHGTQLTPTEFPGWIFGGGAKARNENNQNDVPGDSSVTGFNQVVQQEQTSSELDFAVTHNWAATDVYYLRVEASPMSWTGDRQRYLRPELRQQDDTVLWSTAEDATTAVPLYNNFGTLTDYPSELTFFYEIDASTFTTGAAGQPLKLRIDSSGNRGLYINDVTLVVGPLPADNTAPSPDPPAWAVVPTVSNFTTISMQADSVRDPGDFYGVEYYFENTVANTNSGWQDSREWSETSLPFGTLNTYRVKTRDKSPNQNESGWSAAVGATTDSQDLTPPSPDPLTWATVPEVADFRSITMAINAASDPAGVEYYFENITNSTNSGWQDAPQWTEKDLNSDTSYTYRVRARDKSLDQNVSTTWSAEESATTPTEPAGTLFITRFQDPLISDGTGSPDLGDWTLFSSSSIKIQQATGDGVRTDTDIAIPNKVIQFERTNAEIQYDLDHTWSSSDTFTLTLNASPQSWNGDKQRYIRPSIRQQDGTVLWAPDENLTGPEKTALPLYDDIVGSSYQDDPNLSFSYTIDASTFTTGSEGQPISLRIDSSGLERGLFVDNIHLSLGAGGPASSYDSWATANSVTGGATGDDDSDDLSNLLEFAFGTDPQNTNGSDGDVARDGSANGNPIAYSDFDGGSLTFEAVFARRDDHGQPGSISYTVQFSADLVNFVDSTDTPTMLADSAEDSDYDIVSVPYPFFVPDQNGAQKKARYFRVKVAEAP